MILERLILCPITTEEGIWLASRFSTALRWAVTVVDIVVRVIGEVTAVRGWSKLCLGIPTSAPKVRGVAADSARTGVKSPCSARWTH